MPKIIGFFGSCPADICMYAAYALQNAGKHVCVIDNSEEGILFGCIPTPDARMAAVTFRSVDFMRWEPVVKWQELDYEFVLVQLGSVPQQLCLALCSERILVTDCERGHLDFYHQFMQQSSMTAAVLLRSFCQGRDTVEKRKNYFSYGNRFIERWLLLPFDESDEAYRIEMQYGLVYRFPEISAGMERVLVKLLQMLEIHGRARTVRAVKDAKQGKAAGVVCNGVRMRGCGKVQGICGIGGSVENCILE